MIDTPRFKAGDIVRVRMGRHEVTQVYCTNHTCISVAPADRATVVAQEGDRITLMFWRFPDLHSDWSNTDLEHLMKC
jgi:hypothetical protein